MYLDDRNLDVDIIDVKLRLHSCQISGYKRMPLHANLVYQRFIHLVDVMCIWGVPCFVVSQLSSWMLIYRLILNFIQIILSGLLIKNVPLPKICLAFL